MNKLACPFCRKYFPYTEEFDKCPLCSNTVKFIKNYYKENNVDINKVIKVQEEKSVQQDGVISHNQQNNVNQDSISNQDKQSNIEDILTDILIQQRKQANYLNTIRLIMQSFVLLFIIGVIVAFAWYMSIANSTNHIRF